MQKKTKKTPVKQKKKAQSPKKKNDQPFSLKRLIMGEEKPDLTELEAGSTTILDILSPTTIDTKSRDYIRPLAKLSKAVKVADTSNQGKAESKALSPVTVTLREDTKPFDKTDGVFNKDTLP